MISAARRLPLGLALALAAISPAALASRAHASTPLDQPPTLATFRLDEALRDLSLLRPYFDAEVERPGPYNRYVSGAYGRWAKQVWFPLSWSGASEERDDAPRFWSTGPSLVSNGFSALWGVPKKPVIDWRCRRRPVLFIRYNSQNDRFSLVKCNGTVEIGAVDRLSVIARPPDVPDPGELPDEPDPTAWEEHGEWLPRVKLVNPRLVWLLQKIADAFPFRAVYIYSGYRPHRDKAATQGHHSMHGDGRAMDIQIHGIPNETLFQLCRKLDDVGCGYYPNSKFVHVDVRKPGTGHAFWIDTSGPGEPSHYVDSWPGVVERGALAWMTVPVPDGAPPQGPRPRTPHERGTADTIRK